MKPITQIGSCPLCKKDGQELQDSHYQPAGVYRVLREETEPNPNPIRFTDRGVLQDSQQLSDYLLCWNCEQLFNNNGESWFLAHCWRRTRFPLASTLDSASPIFSFQGTQTSFYHAAGILGRGVTALPYFAASMFWRASAHEWPGCKGIALGPYEEPLRKYLMGEAQFPAECVLLVSVPVQPNPIAGLSLVPYGGRKGNYHCWKLVVLGVAFQLFVGKQIPSTFKRMCFVRGAGNPICRTDLLEKGIMQDIKLKHTAHPHLFERPKRTASS